MDKVYDKNRIELKKGDKVIFEGPDWNRGLRNVRFNDNKSEMTVKLNSEDYVEGQGEIISIYWFAKTSRQPIPEIEIKCEDGRVVRMGSGATIKS